MSKYAWLCLDMSAYAGICVNRPNLLEWPLSYIFQFNFPFSNLFYYNPFSTWIRGYLFEHLQLIRGYSCCSQVNGMPILQILKNSKEKRWRPALVQLQTLQFQLKHNPTTGIFVKTFQNFQNKYLYVTPVDGCFWIYSQFS